MKKILNIAVFVSLLTGFSSCLKDETMIGPDSPNAVQHVVEFLNPAVIASSTTSSVPIYVLSYDITPSAELDIQVSYSGKGNAPNDIKVKVELAPAVIDVANEEQEADMTQIPDDAFSISSYEVTIPKGQKTGTLKVMLFPEKFDLSDDYALPLKIASVSGTDAAISGNFGTILLNIGAKNQWDGIYDVTGTLVDANGLYTGVYPTQCALLSAGATSGLYYQQEIDYPNFLVESISTGGLANTGIRPKFIIAGNVVTVINNGTGATIGSGTYDDATRTFVIEWIQGRWNTHEKWVYSGPR